nr:serine/threonine-protein kinase 11-interacting protein [Megalopta genalis]XP_033339294.1 serine/threonine-protein kinase 11-interacting protein [Megalopta genalis]XP_033339295.1 serine/threonine-protein kinase 11-interacting protein [Megalopta genalis]XP_033339296.1 serine/threonine-protein kinase 11-interacting protein [Megalopta genalis]
MDVEEITKLSKLLRENGDKVLCASSKLSLSSSLIFDLNEGFSLIMNQVEDLESSFQVCNSSKIVLFRDLKFLHDFVQKIVGLKVFECPNSPRIPVDISKFRHLKHLELKKIDIRSVKGLQGIRGQLQSIICTGKQGVCAIKQLLARCGGDASFGFVWSSLKHLALPYNALNKLDASMEFALWLQTLDLSHNMITSADELACLPNLKYVNLGYNKLEAVPVFNKAVSHTLRILVLKNNYIENLDGLQNLGNLTELDLSFNCLMDHSRLWVLENMSTLLSVSLKGNPLSYHPKHRLLCMKYLHSCLSDSQFVLDHSSLSKKEKQIITNNRQRTTKFVQSTSTEFLASTSNSVNSTVLSVSINSSTLSENGVGKSTENSVEKSLIKRKIVKEAVIAEGEQEKNDSGEPNACSSYLETSKLHLETKKEILALRNKFGEQNWLSSYAGTFVQDTDLQASPFFSLTSDSTDDILEETLNTETSGMPSDDDSINNLQADVREKSVHSVTENSESDNVQEARNEKSNEFEETVSATALNEATKAFVDPKPIFDPEKETGDIYTVQKNKNDHELESLFLIISVDDIKERDSLTGKLINSWSTKSVLSCVLGRSEPITVDIIFDTTREHRQNRRYFVEPGDAEKIVTTLAETLKKRPILLKVFKCMKCSTHFSQDTEYVTTLSIGVKQLKCPTCESTLVIETDELSTVDVENDFSEDSSECLSKDQNSEHTIKARLQHSDSYSSIGGTEGGAISVTTPLMHSESHTQVQVSCSATSLEESRESTPSANALNKKYESDIEILSNPSEGSIEVLDEASRTHLTPHRKRSSEERRTAVAPSLLTIPDAIPIKTGLTESSSSGSLTDSVCTAYENKITRQANTDEKSLNTSNNKETKFASVTNLTTLLGGLLQSIKIDSNKSLMTKAEESSHFLSNNIQYSYTDFSSIDHRIKLHIILNIFKHQNEELILLLRADILMQNAKDPFPGCLVLSTSKVYVLQIDGSEGEDPQRWLHKEVSWTMDRLRSFAPLPFKQGVLIELEQPNKLNEQLQPTIQFLCILQDFQRTSNFLFYISDMSLPPSCEIEFAVPEHCTASMHQLLKNCKNYQDGDAVRLLALFRSGSIKCQHDELQEKLSSFIVTANVLVICNMHWLLPDNKEVPRLIREQPLSNLVGVEHNDLSLTLNFLDEIAGQEELWVLDFVSVNAAETVINSIRPPWEELFSIPLQITTCKTSDTTDT